jgi:hypothetical protein
MKQRRSSIVEISSVLSGLTYALPFLFLNAVVSNKLQPLYSIIRPGTTTTALEYILLFLSIFLIGVGAFAAAKPMLFESKQRKLYFVNCVVSLLLFVVFLLLLLGFGAQVYTCDVLQIQSCN